MAQKLPSSQFHVGRGTTAASRRRARQRIAQSIDNPASDLVDKETIPGGGIFTDTDGATITFDMSVYSKHQVTLGGNRTLAVSNVKTAVNQVFRVKLIQGAGGNTVTWWSGIKWAGGVAPTLTAGAGKADWFGFITTGSGTYDGFVIGQNL